MKKFILLLLVCSIGLTAKSQDKLRIALAVNQDTMFTLVGPVTSRTMPVNLSNQWFSMIHPYLNSTRFLIEQVKLPYYIEVQEQSGNSTMASSTDLAAFIRSLKKQKYDLLVYIFRPNLALSSLNMINGASYGIVTSSNLAFSLNDAIIINLNDGNIIKHINIESESDIVSRLGEKGDKAKKLKSFTLQDIQPASEVIRVLNQQFASKIWQNIHFAYPKKNN